jgi:Transposase DDE domain group 1
LLQHAVPGVIAGVGQAHVLAHAPLLEQHSRRVFTSKESSDAENIMDDRRGKNTQLPLPDLLRQSIYSRLAGYEDVNDAERLSQDPTFRLIGSEKIWDRGAALPSRLHWFETEVLTQEENLDGLSRINRELLAKAEAMDSPQRVVLDMDSTEIPVYGDQEQSAYNGHFESTWWPSQQRDPGTTGAEGEVLQKWRNIGQFSVVLVRISDCWGRSR